MSMFQGLSLWMSIGLFAAMAAVVWFAGTRISSYAGAIADRTGLGEAVLGVLLLGGVTSLPELAVTASAASTGNQALAVNNLLGGVAMQIAILALADAVIGRGALTAVVPDSTVLLQGSLGVILLSIAAAGTVIGNPSQWLGIGVWSWAIIVVFIYGIWMITRSQGKRPWVVPKDRRERSTDGDKADAQVSNLAAVPLSGIIWRTVLTAIAITAAGFVLSQTGEVIAERTGLGSSFVGAVLVALATSLPEVSTTLAAARLGLYTMAVSDILGTNLFDVALLFVVDALGGGKPALATVDRFATTAAILGILLTAIYIAGLAERRDRTVLRMGIDSLAVLVAYFAGLGILYQLR